MIRDLLNVKGRARWGAPLVALATAGLVGCGGLLDVTNPNNIPADAINQPVAAGPLVNGVWRHVSFGVSNNLILLADGTDEIEFSGSRDGWAELNRGKMSDGFNEFIDNSLGSGGYPQLAQARWEADNAIKILEAQEAAGTLISAVNLTRAYLIAAIAYVTIPDFYDDFVIGSDRTTPGAPVGEDNMQGLYDVALGYLNKALAMPQATGTLRVQLNMMLARAYFNKNVWALVHKPKRNGGGIVPNNAEIASAVAAANAALAAVPSPAYKFEFTYNTATGSNWFGSEINSRQEMRLAPPYVARVGSNKWGATTLLDPITGAPDVVVDAIQKKFAADVNYVATTITSTREMHLILAEARQAGVTTGKTVQQHINDLRALDGITAWDGATPAPLAMIAYERQANLFLTGRRLADMYRFNTPTDQWEPGAQARSGGWFLPISARECLTNPNIGAAGCAR
jgi:hypothetical protein